MTEDDYKQLVNRNHLPMFKHNDKYKLNKAKSVKRLRKQKKRAKLRSPYDADCEDLLRALNHLK